MMSFVQPSCVTQNTIVVLLECPDFAFEDEEGFIGQLRILCMFFYPVEWITPTSLLPFFEIPLRDCVSTQKVEIV